MLPHQDVADELEATLHPQRGGKMLRELQGIENARATVGAAGYKMKVMKTIKGRGGISRFYIVLHSRDVDTHSVSAPPASS